MEYDYVSKNLEVVHRSPIRGASLNTQSYCHHVRHSCTSVYSTRICSDLVSKLVLLNTLYNSSIYNTLWIDFYEIVRYR